MNNSLFFLSSMVRDQTPQYKYLSTTLVQALHLQEDNQAASYSRQSMRNSSGLRVLLRSLQ